MQQPIQPGLSRGDRTWIHAVTPFGERIHLSGRYKMEQGIEFARGLVGLDRAPTELVWLQEAHQNGADLVGNNIDVRTIRGAVNILGQTPRKMRAAGHLWDRAANVEKYGQLYFINSYSGIRYVDYLLGDSPNASYDRDPALRRGAVGTPFTWVCPNPYFKGRPEVFPFVPQAGLSDGWKVGTVKFRNLGDADRNYPQIMLKGPGTWRMPSGFRDEKARLLPYNVNDKRTYVEFPPLKSNEEVWIDTDPRAETIISKAPDRKDVNLWAQMKGQRPRLAVSILYPDMEDWTFAVKGGQTVPVAEVHFQAFYNSWQ